MTFLAIGRGRAYSPPMDHATADLLMQVAGMAVAIVPVLAVAIFFAIASRRRQAAERAAFAAEFTEAPPPAPDTPAA